ncbi:MAG: hypothetical protein Q8R25_00155 [bacterium]|nr:hypothetical protein [bacterium]
MPSTYNLLVDANRNVLTMSMFPAVINFLHACMYDAIPIWHANYPNYIESFPLHLTAPEEYPEWNWHFKKRVLEKTVPEVTSVLRDKARLAHSKGMTIGKIMVALRQVRYALDTGVPFQETVYSLKRAQSERFKENDYDEKLMLEYPFVMQYADFANVSPQQATDDILFKAQLDEDILVKTEFLRLKYFNAVKKATLDELPALFEEFKLDLSGHTRV